ncbi:MAG TPA: EAL domain-containing protein [Fimbriimonadales bacterium]|nr:EAL domain-containing protein [Fimbriimonadales bacterium]
MKRHLRTVFLGVGVLMRKTGKPAATVFLIVIVAALYFGVGKLGLAFAYFHASASPVWPAAGLALSVLLSFGYRVFPGVFLGAFLVNATTSGDIPTSLGIACGNTLEALTGALLINRFAGGIHVFEKPERVLTFALAALFSSMISPTIGVTSLALGGLAEWGNYWGIWLTWWLGDLSGIIIVSPLLILWGANPKIDWEFQNNARIIEASVAMTLLSVSAVFVFGGVLSKTQEYMQPFLTIPPLLWIAFRFSRKATSFAVLLLGWVALLGTLSGGGALVEGLGLNVALVISQIFVAVASVMAMLLSTAIYSQRQAENAIRESAERFESLANSSPAMIWVSNEEGLYTFLNKTWLDFTGTSTHETTGIGWTNSVHPEDVDNFIERYLTAFEKRESFAMDYRLRHKDGSYRWVLNSGVPRFLPNGEFVGYVGTCIDITERKQFEEQLRREAILDPLTGLSNRLLFLDQLEQCLKNHQNDEPTFAVLFFDVDRLKLINDSLGHGAGDALLIEIGRRIIGVLRPGDTFSRISGDEFAILLRGIRKASDAESIAERIQMALKEPFLLFGQEVFISVSVGIVLGNDTYQRPEEILRDADASMYRAKRLGRNRHVIFDSEQCDYPMDTLQMETDLRRALERKEMMIYYQPIYSLESGELRSFEALIRWNHPLQGLLLPAQFIHLAEDCGTIWSLDRWVLRETCKQIRDWRKFHPDARAFPVSVNLSPRLFSQREFVNEIEEILQETELKGEDIQLEITERSFMEKHEEVAETIRRLREMGIKILLDDFGIGFSSLSYLHRFPIDGVKIDRSFVTVMVEENQGRQVVYAMIQLAHALGLSVVAEGVETPEQLEALRKAECEYAQGYLLGYPMDKEATCIFIIENGGSKLQHEIKLI